MDQLGQVVAALVGGDAELVVVAAEALGDQPRVRQIVEVLLRAEALEADRERLQRAIDQPAHERDVGARVDAARQEAPDRDVGHQPLLDRVLQQLAHARDRLAPR